MVTTTTIRFKKAPKLTPREFKAIMDRIWPSQEKAMRYLAKR